MISCLLFAASALWIAAIVLVPGSTSANRQKLETYYVCDPESHPNPERAAALPAMVG